MKGLKPSSASRWVNCPGSVKLSAPYKDMYPTSEMALEGRTAHWVVEKMVKGEAVAAGDTAPESSVPVNDEMIADARDFVAHLPEGVRTEVEFTYERIAPEGKGRADMVAYADAGKTLILWDYKYGHSHVAAFENMQLLLTVEGFLTPEVEKIQLNVCQPRCFGRDFMETWELTVPKYEARYLPMLQEAAAEAQKEEPEVNTGSHCAYCPARHACKALLESTMRVIDLSASAYDSQLPPESVGKELDLIEEAEKRLKARRTGLEQQVINEIKNGRTVLGYKLSNNYGNTTWSDPAALVLATGKFCGVDLSKPVQPVTPTQAKKLGLDAKTVDNMSYRPLRGEKLERVNMNKIREVYEK